MTIQKVREKLFGNEEKSHRFSYCLLIMIVRTGGMVDVEEIKKLQNQDPVITRDNTLHNT